MLLINEGLSKIRSRDLLHKYFIDTFIGLFLKLVHDVNNAMNWSRFVKPTYWIDVKGEGDCKNVTFVQCLYLCNSCC